MPHPGEPWLNVRACHHVVRRFPIIFGIDVIARVRCASVPEPLLRAFDPAAFAIGQLGNPSAEDIGGALLYGCLTAVFLRAKRVQIRHLIVGD